MISAKRRVLGVVVLFSAVAGCVLGAAAPASAAHSLGHIVDTAVPPAAPVSEHGTGIPLVDANRRTDRRLSPVGATDEVQASALGGLLTKLAIQFLAESIRKGGPVVKQVIEVLDKRAAEVFKQRADEIADELDRIAEIPGVTTRIVKEQLYNALVKAGVAPRDALPIADAVKRVLDILL